MTSTHHALGFFITVALTVCVTVLATASALAVDQQRGKELHHNHCLSCHDTTLYTRPQPAISSYAELLERVDFWQTEMKLNWGMADIDNVAFYLNEFFYKFSCPHRPPDLC